MAGGAASSTTGASRLLALQAHRAGPRHERSIVYPHATKKQLDMPLGRNLASVCEEEICAQEHAPSEPSPPAKAHLWARTPRPGRRKNSPARSSDARARDNARARKLGPDIVCAASNRRMARELGAASPRRVYTTAPAAARPAPAGPPASAGPPPFPGGTAPGARAPAGPPPAVTLRFRAAVPRAIAGSRRGGSTQGPEHNVQAPRCRVGGLGHHAQDAGRGEDMLHGGSCPCPSAMFTTDQAFHGP